MKIDANDIARQQGPDALRAAIDRGRNPFADIGLTPTSDQGTAAPIFDTVIAASLAGKPVPRAAWHVPDLIPANTVAILGGDGGTGKSLVALQLAIATVEDRQWLGMDVMFGSVLFLTAEDDLDEVHRRIAAICAADGIDVASLTDLHIVPLAGQDALLAVPDRKTGVLGTTPLFDQLNATVAQIKPRLVVLDTLADVFGGDEINRVHARQFIGFLRGLALQHSTTVLLLAHPSLSGMASGSGSSGSTGWNNSVRGRLYLTRHVEGSGVEVIEPDPDVRVLISKKSNYSRTGIEIRVRWSDGRFVPIDQQATSFLSTLAADARAERVFLDLVEAYTAEGRHVSPNPSASYAPTVFSKDPRSTGITKRALTAAMNRLFADQRIAVREDGPPSRRYVRIVVADRGPEGEQ